MGSHHIDEESYSESLVPTEEDEDPPERIPQIMSQVRPACANQLSDSAGIPDSSSSIVLSFWGLASMQIEAEVV